MIKKGLNKTLAEVGKIKTGFKGEMKKSAGGTEFQPPKKLDYFIVTTTERNKETGNLILNKEIMDKLGTDKPREIKIRLPFDSVDKNFFTQYQAYNGGKKICAGDGEVAERRGEVTVKKQGDKSTLEINGEEKHEVVCDYETCPIAQAGKCKVSGILSAFLPQSGDLGGVYKYRTHSWNGVSSILGALEYFYKNTGGILQGLPLKLVMIKKTTEEHGNINYATVVIDGEEIRGLRRLAIEEVASRKALGYDMIKVEESAERAGFFEDHDEEAEVEAEFYADGEYEKPAEKKSVIKGTSGAELAAIVMDAAPAPEKSPVVETVEDPTIGATVEPEATKSGPLDQRQHVIAGKPGEIIPKEPEKKSDTKPAQEGKKDSGKPDEPVELDIF
jgi:hypothetical protein